MKNFFNKENTTFTTNSKFFNDQQQNCFSTKAKFSNSTFSTEATVKCQSVLSSFSTDNARPLSFSRPSFSKNNAGYYNAPPPQNGNPFLRTMSSQSSQSDCSEKSQITHKYIPWELKNNEDYKLFMCRKVLKDPKIKTNKTFAKKDFIPVDQYKQEKIETKNYDLLVKKRRKVCTPKGKEYCGRFTLEVKNYKEDFFFYRDEDIGFDEDWQEYMISSNLDEDVETDTEVLGKLNGVVYNDLAEAIAELKNPKNKVQDLLVRIPN